MRGNPLTRLTALSSRDKSECDLLIVIGSSLKVRPVALIPSSLPPEVPQILINRSLTVTLSNSYLTVIDTAGRPYLTSPSTWSCWETATGLSTSSASCWRRSSGRDQFTNLALNSTLDCLNNLYPPLMLVQRNNFNQTKTVKSPNLLVKRALIHRSLLNKTLIPPKLIKMLN